MVGGTGAADVAGLLAACRLGDIGPAIGGDLEFIDAQQELECVLHQFTNREGAKYSGGKKAGQYQSGEYR